VVSSRGSNGLLTIKQISGTRSSSTSVWTRSRMTFRGYSSASCTIGVGGSPESVLRAARYRFPLMLAIIGGPLSRFAPYMAKS
jgi:hypothetical protein